VRSFVLTERAAPFQKGLYYVTPSVSRDGRHLWFDAAFPPSRTWRLAVASLDPGRPFVRLFPATGGGGNPLVCPEGDRAWVAIGDSIYLLDIEGGLALVARLPQELVGNRHLFRLVTDLTLSADGTKFVLDSQIGNRFLMSTADLRTGEVTPLRWFFVDHHHAQFSPVDPSLILVGHGPWHDPVTGEKGDINLRMWIMDTALTRYEPVQPDLWFNRNCRSCHEWWMPDGRVAWVDYDDGVYVCGLEDRRRELVWRHRLLCHAQCDPTMRYFVADENPYGRSEERPCRVLLYDSLSGRETAIASTMPLPPLPPGEWRSYHLDPHPHFSPDGRYVAYTTTALGSVNVALAPVEDALEQLG
jgi:hypothetical protein